MEGAEEGWLALLKPRNLSASLSKLGVPYKMGEVTQEELQLNINPRAVFFVFRAILDFAIPTPRITFENSG